MGCMTFRKLLTIGASAFLPFNMGLYQIPVSLVNDHKAPTMCLTPWGMQKLHKLSKELTS